MKVKVSRTAVIEKNRSFIESFVGGLRANDNAELLGKRIGDKVVVSPDDVFDDGVEITFRPKLVLAVTKDGSLEAVVSLIKALAGGSSIGSLGNNGANLSAIDGVANATISTIESIRKSERNEGTLTILVPGTIEADAGASQDSQSDSKTKSVLELISAVVGFTVTTDNDEFEIANIKFVSDLEGKRGNEVVTVNKGKEKSIEISNQPSVVSIENPAGAVNSSFISTFNVKTDGTLISGASISLIRIDTIKLNLNVKTVAIDDDASQAEPDDKTQTDPDDASNDDKKGTDKTSLKTIEGVGEDTERRFADKGVKDVLDLALLDDTKEIEGISSAALKNYFIPSAKILSLDFNEEEVEGLVKGFNVRNVSDLVAVAKSVNSVDDLVEAFEREKVRFPASFNPSELLEKLRTIS